MRNKWWKQMYYVTGKAKKAIPPKGFDRYIALIQEVKEKDNARRKKD